MDMYADGYCLLNHFTGTDPNGDQNLCVTIPVKFFPLLQHLEDVGAIDDIFGTELCIINRDWFTGDSLDTFQRRVLEPDFYLYEQADLLLLLGGIRDACSTGITQWNGRFCLENEALYLQMCQLLNIIGLPFTSRKSSFTIARSGHHPGDLNMIIYEIDLPDHADLGLPTLIADNLDHDGDVDISLPPRETLTKKEQRIVYEPFIVNVLSVDDYYGFELDGNGRFLLKDCVVTHNTTIAKIIGELYKNMGILSPTGVFRVAKREDLVAEYLGQTAVKTKKILESCLGGVLFIDEVYALGPGKKDNDSFSKEAIDTLNAFLSEHSDSFCCIIAGYEDDIKNCFFSVNQGLERRFQWIHRIETYTTKQLAKICLKCVNDIKWKIHDKVDIKFISSIIDENPELFTSFGGDIENFITKCKMAHARRILSLDNPTRNEINKTDMKLAIELMKPNKLNATSEKDDISYKHMYI